MVKLPEDSFESDSEYKDNSKSINPPESTRTVDKVNSVPGENNK